MTGEIEIYELGVAATVFVFGCIIGSFLNVCIYRLPRGLSVLRPGRSFCPRCRTSIVWQDNIPLVSFLLLRGRCRWCGCLISWRYFIVEGLTGLLLAALYLAQGAASGVDPGQVVIMGLLTTLLIVASAVDMDFLIIPDELSVYGLAGGLLAGLLLPPLHVGGQPWHTFASGTGLPASAIGAVVGGGIVLIAAVVGALIFRKEAMGLGDAKLMAMVGAFMGWKVAFAAFLVAPFFGLLYGVPLLIRKKEHVMPYGPFLSMATVLVMLARPAFCGYITLAQETVREVIGYLMR